MRRTGWYYRGDAIKIKYEEHGGSPYCMWTQTMFSKVGFSVSCNRKGWFFPAPTTTAPSRSKKKITLPNLFLNNPQKIEKKARIQFFSSKLFRWLIKCLKVTTYYQKWAKTAQKDGQGAKTTSVDGRNPSQELEKGPFGEQYLKGFSS